ncbi:MAG: hypothetical protein KAI81_08110, partial [Candidatus Marinimicrobia bacterium]|nr:hypothetical protein [Candidatus Neomarinimicrobiota bacterium]
PLNENLELPEDIPFSPYKFLLNKSGLELIKDPVYGRYIITAPWLNVRWMKAKLVDENPIYRALKILPADTSGLQYGFSIPINGIRPDQKTIFTLIRAIRAAYPKNIVFNKKIFKHFFGNDEFYMLLMQPAPLNTLLYYWERELREFREIAEEIRIYKF